MDHGRKVKVSNVQLSPLQRIKIHMRHDLRTGFQRKLSRKPLTGLTTERGTGN